MSKFGANILKLFRNISGRARFSRQITVISHIFSDYFQVQIYNQYGQFVRKFGANILQHPRGVTVDNKGRIIVVECKVMRVIIFDQAGNVLNKFGCSKHLEFPNGVVVNDRQEIFISDNRAHCVKVFNYEGVYLRQIGGEGNNFAKVFYFWWWFFHVFIGKKKYKIRVTAHSNVCIKKWEKDLQLRRQIGGEGNNQLFPPTIWREKIALLYDFCYIIH